MNTTRLAYVSAAALLVAAPSLALAGKARVHVPIRRASPVAMARTGVAADTAVTVDADGKVIHRLYTNGPVPDTPRTRAAYGGPMSRAGNRTAPAGN
jgi:hypothetical protein